MKKWGLLFLIFLVAGGFLAKFILLDYVVSTGKRVGNLTKLSKKGKLIKTWEGTLDEGSGDKLTSFFSVKSDQIAQELYEFEGRQVVIFYNEHFLGFPRDTKYDIVAWKPVDEKKEDPGKTKLMEKLQKSLFCSFLGSLFKNQDIYNAVKNYIKEDNLYLYKQYSICNE